MKRTQNLKICPVCKKFYSDAYTICRICGLESGKSAPYLLYADRETLRSLFKKK